MIEAKGCNGQVRFDGDYVTIARRGIGKGEKRIPLPSIVSVQWKQAAPFINGFIQFETPGVGGTRSRWGFQTSDARRDENSVIFTRAQMPAFAAVRSAIEHAIALRNQPPRRTAASVAEELGKLAELMGQGILSRQEFEAQKAGCSPADNAGAGAGTVFPYPAGSDVSPLQSGLAGHPVPVTVQPGPIPRLPPVQGGLSGRPYGGAVGVVHLG